MSFENSETYKKSDCMKASSFNFLENERNFKFVPQGTQKSFYQTSDNADFNRNHKVENENIKTIDNGRTESREESPEKSIIISTKSFQESGRSFPKRYVTKCYFQPKRDPVSYSETVIVTLGSKIMKYFDTELYQTLLIPFRWTETVKTLIPSVNESVFQTHYETYVDKPEYHVISLEPQQLKVLDQQLTVAV